MGNNYAAAAASATVLLAGAVVAFVMLVSLHALHDWPDLGLGLHLGGDGGSGTSGSVKQAVGEARALDAGATGSSAGVAAGTSATDTSVAATPHGADQALHAGGIGSNEATSGGDGVTAVTPASGIAAPVQSPPPSSPAGGGEVTPPGGGSGPVSTPGGGGGEGAGAPNPNPNPRDPTSPAPPRGVVKSPDFAACQLQGTAQFSPGLDSSSEAFSYELSGNVEGCQSSQPGAPASGTLSAGEAISEQVTNSITGATDTVIYQEPIPTGSGGCSSSTTEAQALVTWEDGTETVVSYSATGALAAMQLTGSVAPSMTLSAANPAPGDPDTFTIVTTRYVDESTVGLLAFQPPDPTVCSTSAGATTAISGFIGLGGS